jgi:hypothetical protein
MRIAENKEAGASPLRCTPQKSVGYCAVDCTLTQLTGATMRLPHPPYCPLGAPLVVCQLQYGLLRWIDRRQWQKRGNANVQKSGDLRYYNFHADHRCNSPERLSHRGWCRAGYFRYRTSYRQSGQEDDSLSLRLFLARPQHAGQEGIGFLVVSLGRSFGAGAARPRIKPASTHTIRLSVNG